MAIISLGKIRRVIIFPLLMMCNSIFNSVMMKLCAKVFHNAYKQLNSNDETNTIQELDIKDFGIIHSVFTIFVMFIGESLMIVLYFIQRCYTLEKRMSTMEILPGNTRKKTFALLLIIFVLLCDFSSSYGSIFMISSEVLDFFSMILKGIALLIATGLTIGILHYKYYRHHWFGLSIICVGLIVFTIHNLFVGWNKLQTNIGKENLGTILTNILVSYLWVSFQEVIEKYLMDKIMVSPFIVCGLQGVGGVILMLLLFPIVQLLKIDVLSSTNLGHFFSALGNECIGMIKYYVILLFAFCSFNTLRLMNNFHFYPTYKGLSDVFGHFFSWVISILLELDTNDYSLSDYVVKIIAYLFLMIGTLFYLEIIQLNIGGLSINTRKEIIERIDNDINNNIENITIIGLNEETDDEE